MSKRHAQGVVYSTNPNYEYDYGVAPEEETLPPSQQKLRVRIERNHRGGKTVTIVTGFIGTDSDLQDLSRLLKSKCGVGGSAKDGEIIVQGEHLEKVKQLLSNLGYTDVKG